MEQLWLHGSQAVCLRGMQPVRTLLLHHTEPKLHKDQRKSLPPARSLFLTCSHRDNGCCGSQIYGIATGRGTSHCWGNRGITRERVFVLAAFSGGAARELCLVLGTITTWHVFIYLIFVFLFFFSFTFASFSLHLSVWLVWLLLSDLVRY